MAETASERVFTGLSAADGLAIGNLVIEAAADHGERRSGSPAQERKALDDAIAHCREAIRLKLDNAEAHSNLGSALYKNGQPDKAIDAQRRGLERRSTGRLHPVSQ